MADEHRFKRFKSRQIALVFVSLMLARLTKLPPQSRIRLQPGDLVCFSNRRMLHGRTAFTEAAGCVRHLQGCYVAMETFINRLRVLQNSEGDGPKRLSGVQATRCCNGDFS
jgi:hypothetical protein